MDTLAARTADLNVFCLLAGRVIMVVVRYHTTGMETYMKTVSLKESVTFFLFLTISTSSSVLQNLRISTE
jgi:hypothetical protein